MLHKFWEYENFCATQVIYCLPPVLSNTFCTYESYIACFPCTLCRIFYNKKSKVTLLPIPAESEDELQNESDSDDGE